MSSYLEKEQKKTEARMLLGIRAMGHALGKTDKEIAEEIPMHPKAFSRAIARSRRRLGMDVLEGITDPELISVGIVELGKRLGKNEEEVIADLGFKGKYAERFRSQVRIGRLILQAKRGNSSFQKSP